MMDMDAYHQQQQRYYASSASSSSSSSTHPPYYYPPHSSAAAAPAVPHHSRSLPSASTTMPFSSTGTYSSASLVPPVMTYGHSTSSGSGSGSTSARSSQYSGSVHSSPEGGAVLDMLGFPSDAAVTTVPSMGLAGAGAGSAAHASSAGNGYGNTGLQAHVRGSYDNASGYYGGNSVEYSNTTGNVTSINHPNHHISSNNVISAASSSTSTISSGIPSSSKVPAIHPGAANGSPTHAPSISLTGTPLSRPLTHNEDQLLAHLDRLKFFLTTAPSRWSDDAASNSPTSSSVVNVNGVSNGMDGPVGTPLVPHPMPHPALNRFLLPSGEYVTCVLWNGLYHITGTDIVRSLVFRFEAFGRPVRNMKKFEEGVFSDLRNLKPGTDACLEEPKSPFLDLLFKFQCIRTQKKQKVFYWFSVPHDRLFLDALERDLKREKMGMESTTQIMGEPAMSFTYDPKRTLYEQFSKAQGAQEGEGELELNVRRAEEAAARSREERERMREQPSPHPMPHAGESESDEYGSAPSSRKASGAEPGKPFFNMFFEGSPNYKQRRKKGPAKQPLKPSGLSTGHSSEEEAFRHGYQDSPYLGDNGDDYDDVSAAAMFDGQVRMGAAHTPQEEMRRAAENQRVIQAAHIANLNQRAGSVPSGLRVDAYAHVHGSSSVVSSAPSSATHEQQHFPSRSSMGSVNVPNPTGSNSSLSAALMMSGGTATVAHERPHVEARATYPLMTSEQARLAGHSNTMPSLVSQGSMNPSVVSVTTGPPGGQKTKAFVCPLYSCSRLFKRMEHLKRHLRTHTMERPYQCNICQRRFSRADNLNQHTRTHERDGTAPMAVSMSTASSTAMSGLESTADAEAEETERLALAMLNSQPGSQYNLDACMVEVPTETVPYDGEEIHLPEGMTVPAPANGYFMGGNTANPAYSRLVTSPENSPSMGDGSQQLPQTADANQQLQWAARLQQQQQYQSQGYESFGSSQPSPAFTSNSVPSPLASSSMLMNSQTVSNAAYGAAQQGEYSNPSSAGSMSAPSHKLAFDHANMYPAALGLQNVGQNISAVPMAASGSTGPLRRFRSATPTIVRSNDTIRRPSTATSAAGEVITYSSSTRGYHPYAMTAMSNSAHSSPAPFQAQLDYAQVTDIEQQTRTVSRQSSHSHHSRSSSAQMNAPMQQGDEMQQLLDAAASDSVAATLTGYAPNASSASQYGEMYNSASQSPQVPQHGYVVGADGQYYAGAADGSSAMPMNVGYTTDQQQQQY
ncbi:hypothetical protein SCHPADRAFT_207875 [Schizopora paradoxa]|uniref:Wilms tumor protein homolog n=1 Tax=Schizopora paradoxa TaxID=27342 RepID=A0A0H2RX34_9AGAM|nr:hypothetical protein SCHPADRAFT_207875 [Schizopora paradoxa]